MESTSSAAESKKGGSKELRLKSSTPSSSYDSRYDPPPPFPVREPKVKSSLLSNKQFEEFVILIRKVNVNISFLDLLTSFSKYVKFIKNIIVNKKKVKEQMDIMSLSTNCSLVLRKDMVVPKNILDPGSCTIPRDVRDRHFSRALCDLGSGVSLIPLSLASSLDLLGDMRPVLTIL